MWGSSRCRGGGEGQLSREDVVGAHQELVNPSPCWSCSRLCGDNGQIGTVPVWGCPCRDLPPAPLHTDEEEGAESSPMAGV